MVKDDHKERIMNNAAFLKILANPIRLCILDRLLDHEEVCVSDFVSCMGQSQPLISKHLNHLKKEDIIRSRSEGRFVYYRLSDPLAAEIVRLLRTGAESKSA